MKPDRLDLANLESAYSQHTDELLAAIRAAEPAGQVVYHGRPAWLSIRRNLRFGRDEPGVAGTDRPDYWGDLVDDELRLGSVDTLLAGGGAAASNAGR
jgi:hypothetical protein